MPLPARGQASLDALMAFAAAAAFLALLLPAVAHAAGAVAESQAMAQERRALGEIAAAATETAAAGTGTLLALEVSLPADLSFFSYDAAGRAAKVACWKGGVKKEFAVSSPTVFFSPQANLSAGRYSVELENTGGAAAARFTRIG